MNSVVIKKLDSPDEVRNFEKGRFELVKIGGLILGRATYEPGWKWSVHVGPVAGTASCQVSHVGLVLQGRAMVRMDDGAELELRQAGDAAAAGEEGGGAAHKFAGNPWRTAHLDVILIRSGS